MGKAKSKGWSIEYRLPSSEEIEDDPSFIDDVLEYANSPEGLLYSEVSDTVSDVLERADVDAKERQIIWEDGQRLSISASAQRIQAQHPSYPLDLIEERVIEWLEGGVRSTNLYSRSTRRARSPHRVVGRTSSAASRGGQKAAENSPLLSQVRDTKTVSAPE